VRIVAGLGNPGPAYRRTPHNVGFEVVERLAKRFGGTWRSSTPFRGRLARITAGGGVLLAQPATFMNLSGTCVAPLVRYHGAGPANLLVVLDDADLPPGRLRVRPSGSSGGHRGLQSVIDELGTGEFARLRIGVGREPGQGLVEHVLGRLDPERAALVEQAVAAAVEAVLCWLTSGAEEAMNRYNGWSAAPAAGPASEAGSAT